MPAAKKRQSGRIIDYQFIFNTDQGERVLRDLMHTHHVTAPTFVRGDVNEMIFREGERNVVLRILGILGIKAEDIRQMMKEEE